MKYLVEKIIPEDKLVETVVRENKESNTKNIIIKGIFGQSEIKNRNGRMYPLPIMERESLKLSDLIHGKEGRFGNTGHPEMPTYVLDNNVAFQLLKYEQDPGYPKNFIGEGLLLKNSVPYSIVTQCKVPLGISSRGVGSLSNGIVQDDFNLITYDLVFSQSAPDAVVDAVMESKEWIIGENGILTEDTHQTYKNRINKIYSNPKNRDLINEQVNKLFQEFLNTI